MIFVHLIFYKKVVISVSVSDDFAPTTVSLQLWIKLLILSS